MPKRKREITEGVIAERLKSGRGEGRGMNYTPWHTVQEVSSHGLSTRIRSWTVGRVHHVFSQLELRYLYILDWSPLVMDIREQYPLLPLEETQAIAEAYGFKHPTDPKTKHPIIMTSDFFITMKLKGQEIDVARAIKPGKELQRQRVLEKLEIERHYWQKRGMDWGIVTEQEMPDVLFKNLEHLHGYMQLVDRLTLPLSIYQAMVAFLTEQTDNSEQPLREIALSSDHKFGCEMGTSLTVAYHLIVTGQWRVDLFQRLDPSQSLHWLPEERCG